MQTRNINSSLRHPAASVCAVPDQASSSGRGRNGVGRWLVGLAVALAATAITAAPAQAGTVPPTIYCVSDVTQLKNALATIAVTQGSFDLRIRTGYYPLTSSAGPGQINYGLRLRSSFQSNATQPDTARISGAWNSGCTQQSEVISVATSTLIDGQNQTGLLEVDSAWSLAGLPPTEPFDLRIDRLQFANGSDGVFNECVRIVANGDTTSRPLNVTIERIRVELCAGTGLVSSALGTVTVRNSVFLGNDNAITPGVNITANEGTASLYNSTFRFNRMGTASSASQVRVMGPTTYVFNNIFADADYAGGAARDILVSGTSFVRNNRVVGSVVNLFGGAVIQSGNTTAAPGFAAAFGPQLAASSALRDLGLNAVPSPGFGNRDFVGNVRVQGAAVEIGAYELEPLALPDRVFSNGFEAP